MRLITLLEASNCHPKHYNRKTLKRQLLNAARTAFASSNAKEAHRADQA